MDIGSLTGAITIEDQLSGVLVSSLAHVRHFKDEFEGMTGAVLVGAGVIAGAITGAVASVVALGEKGSVINGVEDAFNHLAIAAGSTGDALMRGLDQGVRGTIDSMELMQSTTRLLSSGMKLTEADMRTMGATAREMGKATGTDAAQGLNTLSQALLTGNTRSLKRFGINVDLIKSEKDFAASLGTTRDQLSAAGQMEAHRIAMLEGMRQKLNALGESQLTFKERIQQSTVAVGNWFDDLAKGVAKSSAVNRAFDTIATTLSKTFGGASQTLLQTILSGVDKLADGITSIAPKVIGAIDTIKNKIIDIWNWLVDFNDRWQITNNLIAGAKVAWGVLEGAFGLVETAVKKVRAAWSEMPDWLQRLTRTALEGAGALSVYSIAIGAAATPVRSLISMADLGINILGNLTGGIYASIAIWEHWGKSVDDVTAGFHSANAAAGGYIHNVTTLVAQFGRAMKAWVVEVAGSGAIVKTVFSDIAGVIKGVGAGVGTYFTTVGSAAASFGSALFALATGPIGLTVIAITGLVFGLRALTGSWEFILTPMRYVWDRMKDVWNVAGQIVDQIKVNLQPTITSVGDAFSEAGRKISVGFTYYVKILRGELELLKTSFDYFLQNPIAQSFLQYAATLHALAEADRIKTAREEMGRLRIEVEGASRAAAGMHLPPPTFREEMEALSRGIGRVGTTAPSSASFLGGGGGTTSAYASQVKALKELSANIDEAARHHMALTDQVELYGSAAAQAAESARKWGITVTASVQQVAKEFNKRDVFLAMRESADGAKQVREAIAGVAKEIKAFEQIGDEAFTAVRTAIDEVAKAVDALQFSDMRESLEEIKFVESAIGGVASKIDAFADHESRAKSGTEELSRALSELAQVSDGMFGKLVSGLSTVVASINTARKAVEGLTTETGKVHLDFSAAGLLDTVSGLLALTAAAVQAGHALGGLLGLRTGKLGALLGTNASGRSAIIDFAATFGGFDELHKRLLALGDAGEQMWIKLSQGINRSDIKGATAAIEEIASALGRDASDMSAAMSALGIVSRTELEHAEAIALRVFESMRTSGLYTTSQLAQAWAAYQNAVANTQSGGMSAVAAAAGFQTIATLRTAADQAVALWEYMRDSGLYSADTVQKAWQRAQDALIEAGDEGAKAWQKARDEITKLDEQIKGLQQSIAAEAPELEMGNIERQQRDQLAVLQAQRDAAQEAMDAAAQGAVDGAHQAADEFLNGFRDAAASAEDLMKSTSRHWFDNAAADAGAAMDEVAGVVQSRDLQADVSVTADTSSAAAAVDALSSAVAGHEFKAPIGLTDETGSMLTEIGSKIDSTKFDAHMQFDNVEGATRTASEQASRIIDDVLKAHEFVARLRFQYELPENIDVNAVVTPQYMAGGGTVQAVDWAPRGTDVVPVMLSPGERVTPEGQGGDGGKTVVVNNYFKAEISAVDGASVRRMVEDPEFGEAWVRVYQTNSTGIRSGMESV